MTLGIPCQANILNQGLRSADWSGQGRDTDYQFWPSSHRQWQVSCFFHTNLPFVSFLRERNTWESCRRFSQILWVHCWKWWTQAAPGEAVLNLVGSCQMPPSWNSFLFSLGVFVGFIFILTVLVACGSQPSYSPEISLGYSPEISLSRRVVFKQLITDDWWVWEQNTWPLCLSFEYLSGAGSFSWTHPNHLLQAHGSSLPLSAQFCFSPSLQVLFPKHSPTPAKKYL